MSCGWHSLVGTDGNEAGVYPLRCKRWDCPECGPRKARRVIARVDAGMKLPGTVRFLTLTSPAGETAEASYERFPGRWKRMHQRIVRRFGRFEYVGVVEPQKRGAAHVHVVYRGAFISQRWLSRAAAGSGFGRIADIRRRHPRLASYLAKYLTKQLAAGSVRLDERGRPVRAGAVPKYFRRVRWSRGWCAWTAPVPKHAWQVWRIARVGQLHAAADARARGFEVVELVVGGGGPRHGPSPLGVWVEDYRDHLLAAPAATAA